MSARCIANATHGFHSIIYVKKIAAANTDANKNDSIRSLNERFMLEDPSLLDVRQEYDELATDHIRSIFQQLVIRHIHNTLVARQLLPNGPNNFELVFHFLAMPTTTHCGRCGSFERISPARPATFRWNTEGTEPVRLGTRRDGDRTSTIDMGIEQPDLEDTLPTEGLIRKFWTGYRSLMEL